MWFEPILGVAWVVALPAIAAAVTAAAALGGLGYQIAASEGAAGDARDQRKRDEKRLEQARLTEAQRTRRQQRQAQRGLTWQSVLDGWRNQVLGASQPQAVQTPAPETDFLPIVLVVGLVAVVLLMKK